MTKGSATNGNVNASSIDDISPKDRRDQLIKVRVNAAEKAEIARQKARMSFSAFLRERGLNQGHVYDPTYAAIGGVYQSASTLRDSAADLQEASVTLQNFSAILTARSAPADSCGSNLEACEELREIALTLTSHGKSIEEQANTLAEEARALGQKHISEMLKRYPAGPIKPRDRR